MITNITNENGKLIVTTASGEVAKRISNNVYSAAIVGRKAGKLVIVFASWSIQNAREALENVKAGKFVNHKFTGVTELEIIERSDWEPEDPDAWKLADDKIMGRA